MRDSDAALVELLRTEDSPGVGDLAEALGVTATAVRQRLDRLMRDGIVVREVTGAGVHGGSGSRPRGRPAFGYRLTEKGRRTGGDNFRDLAMVLWREVRSIDAPEVRRGLVSRVGSAMARLYRDRITGASVAERLEETAALLRERQISCAVEPADVRIGRPAVLTTHVCPYPDLADCDRGICASERLMLEELVGSRVTLASCRLDGSDCCRFSIAAGSLPDGESGRTVEACEPGQDHLPAVLPSPLPAAEKRSRSRSGRAAARSPAPDSTPVP